MLYVRIGVKVSNCQFWAPKLIHTENFQRFFIHNSRSTGITYSIIPNELFQKCWVIFTMYDVDDIEWWETIEFQLHEKLMCSYIFYRKFHWRVSSSEHSMLFDFSSAYFWSARAIRMGGGKSKNEIIKYKSVNLSRRRSNGQIVGKSNSIFLVSRENFRYWRWSHDRVVREPMEERKWEQNEMKLKH